MKNQEKAKPGNRNSSQKPKQKLTKLQEMKRKLSGAKFRLLNQQLYTSSSSSAVSLFKNDPSLYETYHEGFRVQVESWPVNPVDVFIKDISNLKNPKLVIADMGCGDAKIAQSFPESNVYSFDLVASSLVTACDIRKTPLSNSSVDICIFCLSLMGTNLPDFLKEAHRILKMNGRLKIAEIESRFEGIEAFVDGILSFGFKKIKVDKSHKVFVLFEFVKSTEKCGGNQLILKPCLYKKR